jgi:hypothetical protein
VQIKADKIDQIKNQMDEDHAEDAKAAQRVQLPDPVGFFHGNHLEIITACRRTRQAAEINYKFFASSSA